MVRLYLSFKVVRRREILPRDFLQTPANCYLSRTNYSQNRKIKKFHVFKNWVNFKGFDREIINFQYKGKGDACEEFVNDQQYPRIISIIQDYMSKRDQDLNKAY